MWKIYSDKNSVVETHVKGEYMIFYMIFFSPEAYVPSKVTDFLKNS